MAHATIPPTTSISVIVPVLREGARINALVDHIRMVGYGWPLEIVVVDGEETASTLAALDRPGVVGVRAAPGRAIQQNIGAAAAAGTILLFLHADTRLPAGAFAAIAAALSGKPRAGAFSLSIRSRHPWLRLIAAGANLRSRLFRLPYGDQAIFCLRNLFFALGGFPNLPIMEDVAFMRTLARAGVPIDILRRRVSTSARRWRAEGVWRATWRNWRLLAGYFRGVSPERLARHYPPLSDAASPKDAR